jgi:hypothetical protein
MEQFRRVAVEVLLLLVLAGIGAYVYWQNRDTAIEVAPDPSCNLNAGPCGAALPGGARMSLSIGPRPIPTVQTLDVRVSVTGRQPDRVEVDFVGVGMNMAYNRPELKRQPDGSYTGQTMLPVCVTQRMRWQATVMLRRPAGNISIPFRFDAGPS